MKSLRSYWIAYGLFRLCMGVGLILFAPTATVMFGALLGRVANPFTLMDIFHVLYICGIVLSFVCGLLGIAGALSANGNGRSGRGFLVVASLLSLPDLPLGIALGACTLILLLPSGRAERLVA
jgi:hypothetical protein